MTSRIFGVDKRLLSGCLQTETMLFDLVPTPSQSRTRQQRLSKESNTNSLATMRHNTFSKKVVSTSSFVTTERLLSTECFTKLPFSKGILPGHDVIKVSNVIKLFIRTINTHLHPSLQLLECDIICHPRHHHPFK